jgi:hypothetical protein
MCQASPSHGQRSWKCVVWLPIGLMMLSCCGATAAFGDDDVMYGVTTLHNLTHNTINYTYRIGEDGDWHQESIPPHHYHWYWYKYDYPGQRISPDVFVTFDSDLTDNVAWRTYRLKRNASVYSGHEGGRHYDFDYISHSRDQINLYGN